MSVIAFPKNQKKEGVRTGHKVRKDTKWQKENIMDWNIAHDNMMNQKDGIFRT